jgi:hypothetical protein
MARNRSRRPGASTPSAITLIPTIRAQGHHGLHDNIAVLPGIHTGDERPVELLGVIGEPLQL